MIDYSTNRARRHYRYALFSTSGFSEPAQKYAIAHQIALVDLSGPEWVGLRDAVDGTAAELLVRVPARLATFPVRLLRQILRDALGTTPDAVPRVPDLENLGERLGFYPAAYALKQRLDHAVDGALLAFPAGQQVLLARPDDLGAFLERVGTEPEHRVTLAVAREQRGAAARTWVVRPLSRDGGEYTLRLTLPSVVEARALAESDRRTQSLAAKEELGGRLDIFWDPRGEHAMRLSGPRLFRLVFASVELRHPRVEQ